MSGRIDKQIATEMGISLGTVRVYWKRIRMKVGGTRSEVIAELARTSLKLNFDDQQSRANQLAKDLEESMVRERQLRVYEAAFDAIPTPLALLDAPGGRILRANPAFAALHGYAPEELQDTASTDLADPAEAAKFEKSAKKAGVGTKAVEVATSRVRKDSTCFTARATVSSDGVDTWVLALKV